MLLASGYSGPIVPGDPEYPCVRIWPGEDRQNKRQHLKKLKNVKNADKDHEKFKWPGDRDTSFLRSGVRVLLLLLPETFRCSIYLCTKETMKELAIPF